MNRPLLPLGVRWLMRSQRSIQTLVSHLQAMHSGIAMGLLSDSELERFDSYPYSEYDQGNVHESAVAGFEAWERDAVKQYFANTHSVLMLAAGGAREMLALERCGKLVTGIEFGENFAQLSNQVLTVLGSESTITVAPRYRVPKFHQQFDGAVIGRKFYSLLHNRHRRIQFLSQIRARIPADAPLLFGFYTRTHDTLDFRYQAGIANVLRRVRQYPQHVEVGDHMDPGAPVLHHHFTLAEINQELHEAGFRLQQHGQTWFGFAVAKANQIQIESRPCLAGATALPGAK